MSEKENKTPIMQETAPSTEAKMPLKAYKIEFKKVDTRAKINYKRGRFCVDVFASRKLALARSGSIELKTGIVPMNETVIVFGSAKAAKTGLLIYPFISLRGEEIVVQAKNMSANFYDILQQNEDLVEILPYFGNNILYEVK